MRIAMTSLALALGLLGASGCFYTDEINEKPTPGIRVLDEGPYYVGDQVRFDATKSLDDERNALLTEWQAYECTDAPMPLCTPLREELRGGLDTVFAIDLETHLNVVVELRVTDSRGATRLQADTYALQVGNRLPSVEVQTSGHKEGPGGPFILYRGINLIAIPGGGASEFDGDGDEVTFDWQLLPPATSQSADRSFEAVGDEGYRLIPDVPGEWSVIVTADDGVGDPVEERKDFFVGEDKPPCLQGMEPAALDDAYYLVDSVDGARRFSVLSVSDALDSFPAQVDPDPVLGEAEFRWFLQEPGSADFVELSGYAAADYLVDPEVYNPGDRLALRVEVSDRVVGPERELACADEVWSCALDTGSGCFQRLTWGVDIR